MGSRAHSPGHGSREALEAIGDRVAAVDFGGSGPLAVLVHGGGMNLEWWRPCAELLTAQVHVIGLDLQGHGQSVAHTELGYDTWMADVISVLDCVGSSSAILIGHSFGGRVVLGTAAHYPDRCAAVAVVDGTLVDWNGPARTLLQAAEDEDAYLAAAAQDPVKSFDGTADELDELIRSHKFSDRRAVIVRRRFVEDGEGRLRHNPTPSEALEMIRVELDGRGLDEDHYDRIASPVLSLYTRDSASALGDAWPYTDATHDRLRASYGFDVGWIDGDHNGPSERPHELAGVLARWLRG